MKRMTQTSSKKKALTILKQSVSKEIKVSKEVSKIKLLLVNLATDDRKSRNESFFKTSPGQYGEHDKFLGLTNPVIRNIAKDNSNIALNDIQVFLDSKYNEERFLGLVMMINKYDKANDNSTKDQIYDFYLDNLKSVNNWNLVDCSAHLIIGKHLLHSPNKNILLKLSYSSNMWERRIAIVSTLLFIRNNSLEWTLKLSEILLNDDHDLIHKAVGWMLREAGKKNISDLEAFLDKFAATMPRTMLRYSIEKFNSTKRKYYLDMKLNAK
eukprot:gene4373-6188_t